MHQIAGDMAILWSQNLPRIYLLLMSALIPWIWHRYAGLCGATASGYTDNLGFPLPSPLLFSFVLLLSQNSYDDANTDCKKT
jgi:hypothetical protein